MLVACWSVKGGSGTTVVSIALAAVLAHRSPATGALLADLAGDAAVALGLPDLDGRPGLTDWLAAGPDVPADALGRLEVGDGPFPLLPFGTASSTPLAGSGGRGDVLAALLGADPRPVVADCGTSPTGAALAVAASATHSLLVLRPCYLALRRAQRAPIRPSGVVVVDEPDRSLTPGDVEDALDVPVRAVVPVDARIARAVDAGLLAHRLPRPLEKAVRRAA